MRRLCSHALRCVVFLGALVMVVGSVKADVTPRFEGLRSDSTYMALLSREAVLSGQESKLLESIDKRRAEFKVGDAKSQRKIEDLEFELFDLQRERGEVSSEVRAIEQQWELQSLEIVEVEVDGGVVESGERVIVAESVASIADSRSVRDLLSGGNLALLKSADRREVLASDLYDKFMTTYHQMRNLQQLYAQSESEEEASVHIEEFRGAMPLSDSLLLALEGEWRVIYADKIFLFNLILEELDREDLLLKGEIVLRNGAPKVAFDREAMSSVAMIYNSQRRALVEYELLVAEALKLERAVDSLRNIATLMGAAEDVEVVEDVNIRERNFIKYDDIKFSSSQVYKNSSAIPEAKLYKKGTIYRIQLGAYKTPQPPTVFRGAYPLSYDKTFGFWTCYTGAYATMIEAQKAQALCKKKGFKRPEIVAWRDGERRNLGREPLPATAGYRVVIVTHEGLSDRVLSIIERCCGEVDITRVGADRYIVGDLSHIYIAQDLVEALTVESDELELTITEIK